jgi:large conductance mechanosensitive channel
MLKGFKEFLSRGNIVDLSIAVVIGTAFTALVTKFTDSVIQPLINRIGGGGEADHGILRINIGGGQTIDLNIRCRLPSTSSWSRRSSISSS